ncbi:C-type mannose receptor 2-like [Salarias fasciatus]|uniref:C-type mannose receptor 2-like n=1 Tax=Salarias fasciatus TaxID=181472 RepID=A0A672I8B3_SALFA|nr:C-type mannose receptor 2-like [Salarias fasciatus]
MKRKFSLLVSVLLFVSPISGYVFKYVSYTGPDMMTWSEARKFCRERHSDLATVRYNADDKLLANTEGFIGLHRDNNTDEWKWSRVSMPTRYLNWATNEPQPDKHCGFKIEGEVKWRSEECDDVHPFVCFDESVLLVQHNKTWEEALDHCRWLWRREESWSLRFDLSTVISQNDVTNAREMAQYATTEEVWTGLRFLAGHWWWVGGEPAEWTKLPSCRVLWHPGQTWQFEDQRLRRETKLHL